MMEKFLKFQIASNRKAGVVRNAASLAQRFLNAYHYTGEYEFEQNGEKFALEQFARFKGRMAIIWDVGAHLGEYAEQAHVIMPESRIVSFEIIPEIATQLRNKFTGDWFQLYETGLSDSTGEIDVAWNKIDHSTNAIQPFVYGIAEKKEVLLRRCPITTIDYLISQNNTPPDLLKIDFEGHEKAVLFGASDLLASKDAPVMIQFEYGATWIPSSATLYSVQSYLEGFGYSVGRLYPDHVEFKSYSWQDEHFRMGNMIASKDVELTKLLSN